MMALQLAQSIQHRMMLNNLDFGFVYFFLYLYTLPDSG